MKKENTWVERHIMEIVNNNSENCLFTPYTKLLHELSKKGDAYRLSDHTVPDDALFSLMNSGVIKAHAEDKSYLAFMKKREDFKAHLYKYSIHERVEKLVDLFIADSKWKKMWFESCLNADDFIEKYRGKIAGERFGL